MSLAALFLFTGCSAQITVSVSSGWLTDPATNYDSSFYESLDYEVRFKNSDTADRLTIVIDEKNSSYNVTTEAVGTKSFPMPDGSTQTYTNVYHLKMTLTLSATYTYERDNGETLSLSFGGANDTDPSNTDFTAEDADIFESEVWFTSPQTTAQGSSTVPPAFSPIRSVVRARTHSATTNAIDDESSVFVSLYDYSITIAYDQTCSNARITYTDAFADLSDEERAAGDYARKAGLNFPDSRDVDDLQKEYTCIDNEQLIFLTRGLAMNTDTTHTLTVVSGTADRYPSTMRIACSELVENQVTFTMINKDGSTTEYGKTEDDQIPVAKMVFSLTGTGSNVGENTTVTYAQRSTEGANTNRCLPVQIENPYGTTVGNYVYTLTQASYVKPDNAQA